MALSGCCSHEAIRVNLIPRPAEMEVLSGYFQPGNTTVDDFTTVVVDNSRTVSYTHLTLPTIYSV